MYMYKGLECKRFYSTYFRVIGLNAHAHKHTHTRERERERERKRNALRRRPVPSNTLALRLHKLQYTRNPLVMKLKLPDK